MNILTMPFRLLISLIFFCLVSPVILLWGVFKPQTAKDDLKFLIVDLFNFIKRGI
jgi:hypothetical protein